MYTILTVEGEDIIRRGICNSALWETLGCIVVGEACNGEEGTALAEQLTPDIIITDISMPVVDGLQTLSQTKETFDYIAIILTDYSNFEYAKEVIRCGVAYYVLKPFNMEEMREALEEAVLEMKNITIIRRQTESTRQLKSVSLLPAPDSRKETDLVADQVLDFIAANYKRKPSLVGLEAKLHYPERCTSQRFQKAVGTAVTDYLNRYRIQKALNLLKEHETPVSNIGWKCSIGDCKYFHYVFKKYMDCLPKDYQAGIKS